MLIYSFSNYFSSTPLRSLAEIRGKWISRIRDATRSLNTNLTVAGLIAGDPHTILTPQATAQAVSDAELALVKGADAVLDQYILALNNGPALLSRSTSVQARRIREAPSSAETRRSVSRGEVGVGESAELGIIEEAGRGHRENKETSASREIAVSAQKDPKARRHDRPGQFNIADFDIANAGNVIVPRSLRASLSVQNPSIPSAAVATAVAALPLASSPTVPLPSDPPSSNPYTYAYPRDLWTSEPPPHQQKRRRVGNTNKRNVAANRPGVRIPTRQTRTPLTHTLPPLHQEPDLEVQIQSEPVAVAPALENPTRGSKDIEMLDAGLNIPDTSALSNISPLLPLSIISALPDSNRLDLDPDPQPSPTAPPRLTSPNPPTPTTTAKSRSSTSKHKSTFLANSILSKRTNKDRTTSYLIRWEPTWERVNQPYPSLSRFDLSTSSSSNTNPNPIPTTSGSISNPISKPGPSTSTNSKDMDIILSDPSKRGYKIESILETRLCHPPPPLALTTPTIPAPTTNTTQRATEPQRQREFLIQWAPTWEPGRNVRQDLGRVVREWEWMQREREREKGRE